MGDHLFFAVDDTHRFGRLPNRWADLHGLLESFVLLGSEYRVKLRDTDIEVAN